MQKKVLINSILISLLSVVLFISCKMGSPQIIDVFYKNKPPSLQTLEKVNTVLDKHEDKYEIFYFDILDSKNMHLINKYKLPGTHFPFAIVVNGKFSAKINNNKIDFVHFPLFMHGIGRHEGNWSLDDLEIVLKDNTLLLSKNVLPELEEGNDEPCPE